MAFFCNNIKAGLIHTNTHQEKERKKAEKREMVGKEIWYLCVCVCVCVCALEKGRGIYKLMDANLVNNLNNRQNAMVICN